METIEVVVSGKADAGLDLFVCDNATVTIGALPAEPGYVYAWEPSASDWRNGTDETSAMPDVFVATTTTFSVTVSSGPGCDQIEETSTYPAAECANRGR